MNEVFDLAAFKALLDTPNDAYRNHHLLPMARHAAECIEWLNQCIKDDQTTTRGVLDSLKKAQERIKELEAEFKRVAPFLAMHGFGGYGLGPAVPVPHEVTCDQHEIKSV